MKRVIIIPGLGDNEPLYRLVLPFWWLAGFRGSVYAFNWNQDDGKFTDRFNALLDHIQSFPKHDQLYVIGCSAGGVPALLSLQALPKKVVAAVAIASPLHKTYPSLNKTLNAGFLALKKVQFKPNVLKKFLSVYGQKDEIIALHHSQLPGAHCTQTKTKGHIAIIAHALTLGSRPIIRFLKNR